MQIDKVSICAAENNGQKVGDVLPTNVGPIPDMVEKALPIMKISQANRAVDKGCR